MRSMLAAMQLYCKVDESRWGQAKCMSWAAIAAAEATVSFPQLCQLCADKGLMPGEIQLSRLEDIFRKTTFTKAARGNDKSERVRSTVLSGLFVVVHSLINSALKIFVFMVQISTYYVRMLQEGFISNLTASSKCWSKL